jgi:small subunit ribosomal protein S27Ae
MAKESKGKAHPNKVYKSYKVEGESVSRLRKSCPKCGEGVFLSQHKDRVTCGKCGYTEFSKKEKPEAKQESKPKEEKK